MSHLTYITPDFLAELDACEEHILLVADNWPRGVPLTRASARKAGRLGLDTRWLVEVIDTELVNESLEVRLQLARDRARLYERRRAAAAEFFSDVGRVGFWDEERAVVDYDYFLRRWLPYYLEEYWNKQNDQG